MQPLYKHWGEDYLGGIPCFSEEDISAFEEDVQKLFGNHLSEPLYKRWYSLDGIKRAIQAIRAIQSRDRSWQRFLDGFERVNEIENGRDLRGLDSNAAYLSAKDSITGLFVVARDASVIEVDSVLNLEGADLMDTSLQGAVLRWANLEDAVLGSSKLQFSDLLGANLQGAQLSYANLSKANLRKTKLRETHLYDANLQEANLSDADLQRAQLCKANLKYADLGFANLQEAELTDANLQAVKAHKADMRGARFYDANLQEADLSGSKLKSAQLYKANLQRANLESACLHGTILSEANLIGTVLAEAELQGAVLLRADLLGADLSGANLQSANLGFSNLVKVNFKKAHLQKAELLCAVMEEADLSGALLHEANLHGARLYKANLQEANLIGADLSFANLEEANLREANISGANLKGAKLLKASLIEVEVDAKTILSKTIMSGAILQDLRVCDGEWRNIIGLDKAFISGLFLRDTTMPENSESSDTVGRKPLPYENLADFIIKSTIKVELDNKKCREVIFSSKGRCITANISQSIHQFVLGNEAISFNASDVIKLLIDEVHCGECPYWNLNIVFKKEVLERCLLKSCALQWHLAIEFYNRARSSYLYLKNNYLSLGRYDDASCCAIREKECERKIHHCELLLNLGLWSVRPLKRFVYHSWKELSYIAHYNLSRYGENPWQIFLWMFIAVLLFPFLLGFPGAGLVSSDSAGHVGFVLWNSEEAVFSIPAWFKTYGELFYFSAVSLSTLGYGDIAPLTVLTRVFASIEAFVGIFLTATFVWTLGRKVAGR